MFEQFQQIPDSHSLSTLSHLSQFHFFALFLGSVAGLLLSLALLSYALGDPYTKEFPPKSGYWIAACFALLWALKNDDLASCFFIGIGSVICLACFYVYGMNLIKIAYRHFFRRTDK